MFLQQCVLVCGGEKNFFLKSFQLCVGLAKLGNTVAEANVSQFSCARNTLRKQILLIGNKNVFASGQKRFCFPVTNFASQTYVSKFSHHESNVDLFPVLLIKNVS